MDYGLIHPMNYIWHMLCQQNIKISLSNYIISIQAWNPLIVKLIISFRKLYILVHSVLYLKFRYILKYCYTIPNMTNCPWIITRADQTHRCFQYIIVHDFHLKVIWVINCNVFQSNWNCFSVPELPSVFQFYLWNNKCVKDCVLPLF